MADDRMAALELLRKAAGDGDLDFLKEGVAVLAQLVMDAEVSTQIRAAHGERCPCPVSSGQGTARAGSSAAGFPATSGTGDEAASGNS
jgi:hypothetical protein